MGFAYDPGPLEFLDPSRFPDEVVVNAEMETLVTPSAANLIAAEGYTATRVSEIAGAGIPDVAGETAAVLRPAYDEVGHQLRTEHELRTDPIVRAVVGSLGEVDGVRADLPSEDSSWDPPHVPGEGTENPIEQPGGGERPPL